MSIYFGIFENYSRTPLLEDPYEKENVYVAPSKIGEAAGEGLYARKHIRKGQLVCLFNGIRCNKPGHHTTIRANDDDWSDYRLTLGMYGMSPNTLDDEIKYIVLSIGTYSYFYIKQLF